VGSQQPNGYPGVGCQQGKYYLLVICLVGGHPPTSCQASQGLVAHKAHSRGTWSGLEMPRIGIPWTPRTPATTPLSQTNQNRTVEFWGLYADSGISQMASVERRRHFYASFQPDIFSNMDRHFDYLKLLVYTSSICKPPKVDIKCTAKICVVN
jgi:hypothetical protein